MPDFDVIFNLFHKKRRDTSDDVIDEDPELEE